MWRHFLTFLCSLTLTLGLETVLQKETVHLFSSTDALQKLYDKEVLVRQKLEGYLKDLQEVIQNIDKFLDVQYSDFNHSDYSDAYEYVSNPINTFTMLKRTGMSWPYLKGRLEGFEGKETMKEIQGLLDKFPKDNDVEGAANGLFLLHETYNLNLTQFIDGIVEVPKSQGQNVLASHTSLAYTDIENLGKLAFNRGYYDRAIEWVDAGLYKATKNNDTQVIQSFMQYRSIMRKKHDQVLDLKGPRGMNWRTFLVPFDEKLKKKRKFKKLKHKDKRFKVETKDQKMNTLNDFQLWEVFNSLCRGEEARPMNVTKDLKCQFLHRRDPYLRLGPFKIEEQSKSPFIAVFHDFMTDDEVEWYKSKVEGTLYRSTHGGKRNVDYVASVQRTSSQTWLGEYDSQMNPKGDKVATKVSWRIANATGLFSLVIQGNEPFQVANYGIGGVYNSHVDSKGELGKEFKEEEELYEAGDRLATAMAYLTDVKAGGATVFPNAKVTVWPKKGNLVFWYNNDFNGALDLFTFHGGCPVLAGSKWITNKWIRSRQQWANYKCLVTKNLTKVYPIPPLSNDPGIQF